MESEAITGAAVYLAVGVSAWSVCKYAIKPLIEGMCAPSRKPTSLDALNQLTADSRECYVAAVNARAKVIPELSRDGKSEGEIVKLLDQTIPLPSERKFDSGED